MLRLSATHPNVENNSGFFLAIMSLTLYNCLSDNNHRLILI